MSAFNAGNNNTGLDAVIAMLRDISERLERIERHLIPTMEPVSSPVMVDVTMETSDSEPDFEPAPIRPLPIQPN